MAIINLAVPFTVGTVVGGIQMSMAATGQIMLLRSRTNMSAKNRGAKIDNSVNAGAFPNTDDIVVMLDARYDGLADKAPWETYAGEMAGKWAACTNCTVETGAKKLYRVVNLNRLLIGLAIGDDVPEFLDTTGWGVIEIDYFGPVFGGPYFNRSAVPETVTTLAVTSLLNLGLGNPTIIFPLGMSVNPITPGTTEFGYWSETFELAGFDLSGPDRIGSITTCLFGPDGQPGPGPRKTIITIGVD